MLHLEHTVSFTPVSPALHESRRHFFDIRMLSVPYLSVNLYNQNYSLFTSFFLFSCSFDYFLECVQICFLLNIIYF